MSISSANSERQQQQQQQQSQQQEAWAYADDIPGSRCGPEDGPWPRSYKPLDDAQAWKELSLLSRPQSKTFDAEKGLRADSVNFQPCRKARTQDRYLVKQLDVYGKTWTITGVFDGHLGEATVEHVAYHLPRIVSEFLHDALKDDPALPITPSFISDLLSRSIVAFDDAIAGDVLKLFPGGIEGLKDLSDREISSIINDQHRGGSNYQKARLCMYGTTALVVLVDPNHEHMWVANVGDCQALLVSPDSDGSGSGSEGDNWHVELLTRDHNGDNDAEVERVRREHPGEPDCVSSDRRVLGALAPFRSLGDVPFKQPPEFSRRILYNLLPGFHDTSPWEEFLVKNLTPPYISAQPDVIYRSLPITRPAASKNRDSANSHTHERAESVYQSSALCLPGIPIIGGLLGSLFKTSSSTSARASTKGSSKSRSSDESHSPTADSKMETSKESSANSRGHIPTSSPSPPPSRPSYLVICSDGFADLCSDRGAEYYLKNWAKDLSSLAPTPFTPSLPCSVTTVSSDAQSIATNNTSEKVPGSPTSTVSSLPSPSIDSRRSMVLDDGPRGKGNLALRLLREVIGGNDAAKVSKVLTLEMSSSWIDDTSIVVQTL